MYPFLLCQYDSERWGLMKSTKHSEYLYKCIRASSMEKCHNSKRQIPGGLQGVWFQNFGFGFVFETCRTTLSPNLHYHRHVIPSQQFLHFFMYLILLLLHFFSFSFFFSLFRFVFVVDLAVNSGGRIWREIWSLSKYNIFIIMAVEFQGMIIYVGVQLDCFISLWCYFSCIGNLMRKDVEIYFFSDYLAFSLSWETWVIMGSIYVFLMWCFVEPICTFRKFVGVGSCFFIFSY